MLVSHEKLASQFKIFRISKVWLSFSLNDKYLETCSQSKILLEKSHFCVKFAGFSKMRVCQQNICFIWNIHTKVPGAYHLSATHATIHIRSLHIPYSENSQAKQNLNSYSPYEILAPSSIPKESTQKVKRNTEGRWSCRE